MADLFCNLESVSWDETIILEQSVTYTIGVDPLPRVFDGFDIV